MGLETITTDRKEEIAQSIGEILKELIKKARLKWKRILKIIQIKR